MSFIEYLEIIGLVLLGIVVLYIIIRLTRRLRVVESSVASAGEIDADQFYYLPGYGMTIRATALVDIYRNDDDEFQKFQLQSLKLETDIILQPDTSELIALSYKPDIYASDDISITTSPDSLLQNIATVTEDRISTIIKDITAAPGEALKEMRANIAERGRPQLEKETIEVSKTFRFDANKVSGGSIKLDWQISIEGEEKKIDISQELINKSATKKTSLSVSFGGVLTRPMSFQTWELKDSKLPDAFFTCYAPDASRLIKVPIRRAYFIKKQQLPKFANGILVENHIIKDSEVEGAASIPINILKAIVSIPSQIFRFRIIRNNLEAEFDRSITDRLKAKDELLEEQKKSLQALSKEVQDLKQVTKKEEAPPKPQPPSTGGFPALGKLPAEQEKGPESIFAKTRAENLRGEIKEAAAQPFPKTCFWHNKFSGDWKDYGNIVNGIKSCVPAAAAHMITCWSSNTRTDAIVVPEIEIENVYEREGKYVPGDPSTDNGCFLGTFLLHWQTLGIGNFKITRAAKVTKQDSNDLKHAISLFGPAMIGFKMPDSAKQNLLRWTVTQGKGSEAGSWGGHAVTAVGYDEDGLVVISWGKLVRVDWNFYQAYNDESYVALSDLWVTADQPSPSQMSLEELNNAIINLRHS